MPLFQTIMTAKATMTPLAMSNLSKAIATEVIKAGGVVRTVENLGIRQLPYRFKSRFADRNGIRYHYDGRFLAMRFDASPDTLSEVERLISSDDDVLRYFSTRPVEPETKANVNKWKKNEFLPGDFTAWNLEQLVAEQEAKNKA